MDQCLLHSEEEEAGHTVMLLRQTKMVGVEAVALEAERLLEVLVHRDLMVEATLEMRMDAEVEALEERVSPLEDRRVEMVVSELATSDFSLEAVEQAVEEVAHLAVQAALVHLEVRRDRVAMQLQIGVVVGVVEMTTVQEGQVDLELSFFRFHPR